MTDKWEDEARRLGAELCTQIEGWCPADPATPDSEIDPRKGRKCKRAEGYAEWLLPHLRAAYEAGRKDAFDTCSSGDLYEMADTKLQKENADE